LYFYPKDNTQGCTTEACDFTVALPDFEGLDAVILGVSPDSPKKHRNFIEKKELQITLLADEDKEVLESYGVWQLKKMYGREYMGVVRSTFLIDPDGKIAKIWDKVKVKGHVEAVKKELFELK
jgi:peroxiredoxin Q/BCP